MIFLSLLFFVLAAACNAVMDTLQYHFYSSKIYYTLRKPTQAYWWNPEVSWKNKYIDRYPPNGLRKWLWFDVPFTDGWHTFKSIMVLCLCFSLLFAFLSERRAELWIDLLCIPVWGICWNLTFNLFYNKILIKKK
jgi:hypothetical protein